jgi:single-strand DNA-binding protein
MLNMWQGIGRLGKDPVLKATQSGQSVANFSIACSEKYKDKNGEKQEVTFWAECVAWGKLGDIVGEYFKKGNLLYVSGKLQSRKWKDKEGNDRFVTEIIVNEAKNLSPRESDSYAPPPMPQNSTGEEVPF